MWEAALEEAKGLQDGASRASRQIERLEKLETEVAQLQNVLEVVCAELETGQKASEVYPNLS